MALGYLNIKLRESVQEELNASYSSKLALNAFILVLKDSAEASWNGYQSSSGWLIVILDGSLNPVKRLETGFLTSSCIWKSCQTRQFVGGFLKAIA